MSQNPEKVGDDVDMKETRWYWKEQESVSEAIAKGCLCRRWMMVELVL